MTLVEYHEVVETFATVAWLISIPSLRSSPWIRGAQPTVGAAHLANQIANLAID